MKQQPFAIEREALQARLRDIKEAKRMLRYAQHVAPKTERVLTDGHGNWYGVRKGSGLPIPTTHVFGPDNDFKVERFEE